MLLTSLQTAQRLEEADIAHIRRQIEACSQLFPDHKSFNVPVSAGIASITLPSFGRKLNRITGYGMKGPVSGEELAVAEDLFKKNGVAEMGINMCPLADPSALQALTSRGFFVENFINSYARHLTDEDLKGV